MGTNYYIEGKACPCCGNKALNKHIGKSSAGWMFSLHVYPEEGIDDLVDWLAIFFNEENTIINEYGDRLDPGVMSDIIVNRTAELLRHSLSDRVIGHGQGTWDLVTGDFS